MSRAVNPAGLAAVETWWEVFGFQLWKMPELPSRASALAGVSAVV